MHSDVGEDSVNFVHKISEALDEIPDPSTSVDFIYLITSTPEVRMLPSDDKRTVRLEITCRTRDEAGHTSVRADGPQIEMRLKLAAEGFFKFPPPEAPRAEEKEEIPAEASAAPEASASAELERRNGGARAAACPEAPPKASVEASVVPNE